MPDLTPTPREGRWQDWLNLVLACWLFISPWVLGFAPGGADAAAGAAWNCWIFAIVIGVFSVAALVRPRPWEEWINLLSGVWLFISPWLIGFSGSTPALWNALIVGALVFIAATWDLTTLPQTAGRHA